MGISISKWIPVLEWGQLSHNPFWNGGHSNLGHWAMTPRFGIILIGSPHFKMGIPIWFWVGILENSKTGSPHLEMVVVPNWGLIYISKVFKKSRYARTTPLAIIALAKKGGLSPILSGLWHVSKWMRVPTWSYIRMLMGGLIITMSDHWQISHSLPMLWKILHRLCQFF